jgi:hypothetical protein
MLTQPLQLPQLPQPVVECARTVVPSLHLSCRFLAAVSSPQVPWSLSTCMRMALMWPAGQARYPVLQTGTCRDSVTDTELVCCEHSRTAQNCSVTIRKQEHACLLGRYPVRRHAQGGMVSAAVWCVSTAEPHSAVLTVGRACRSQPLVVELGQRLMMLYMN